MQTARRLLPLFLAFSFVALSLPAFAQQVIATVPVGIGPDGSAVNPVTNNIYVPNYCGSDSSCTRGTVTVIDGVTNNTLSVNVGVYPSDAAVNSVTNKIYVANSCGDPTCASDGTVSVIDGVSNTVIATVTAGSTPYAVVTLPSESVSHN